MSRRTFFSFSALLFLTTAYLVTLAFADSPPVEVFFVVVGISVGMYFLAVIPNLIFRWSSRHSLSKDRRSPETDQPVQFGIRHILVLMTCVAVLVPVSQFAFRETRFSSGAPWMEILTFIALYGLMVWGAFLLTIACVFSKKRVRYYVSLVAYSLILPVLVAILISLSFASFQPLDTENCVNGVAFAAGFAFSMIAILTAYYSIGYRLRGLAGIEN